MLGNSPEDVPGFFMRIREVVAAAIFPDRYMTSSPPYPVKDNYLIALSKSSDLSFLSSLVLTTLYKSKTSLYKPRKKIVVTLTEQVRVV